MTTSFVLGVPCAILFMIWLQHQGSSEGIYFALLLLPIPFYVLSFSVFFTLITIVNYLIALRRELKKYAPQLFL